jgi:hypothetical protein
MFTGLVRDQMILRRLGMADVEEFPERPGATPFIAMGGDRMKQGRALAHGRSLPAKLSRRRG